MRVPGGHEARATSAQGKTHRERDAPMTTINEIKDRLDALESAGRSYAGLDPRVAAQECAHAAAAFEQNAAADVAYLLARIKELQKAIITAAAELSDAASDIAASYAAEDEETEEIRIIVCDPVDKLVAVAQGASAQTEGATK